MIKRKKTNKLRSRLVCILVAVLLILSCMPSTLAADTVSCNISVNVTADGIAPANNTFSFGLYDGNKLVETKSNTGGTVTFSTIPKPQKEKNYTYTIKPLNAGNYTVSPESITATVSVEEHGYYWHWYTSETSYSNSTFAFNSPYVPPDQPEQTFDPSTITPVKSATATENTDEYTLNLSMSGSQLTASKNTDYVLVIDTSTSMDYELGNTGKTRLETLKETLTADKGFVDTILPENSGNRIAVVHFAGIQKSGIDQNLNVAAAGNADSTKTVINNLDPGNWGTGTNYCAGLKYAGEVLDTVSQETASRNKVMIFLSDGDANEALTADGSETDRNYENLTNNYITSFKTKYSSCSNYTIAYATSTSTLLGNIATSATNQYNYSATNSLAQIFAAIATETSKMQSVSIQDTLSDYVTLPDSIADSDFTVVKTDANGNTTTLTKDTDYTLSYASGSKTVEMILAKPLGLNETVNLSFPVKLTDAAYQQTAESLNTNLGSKTDKANTLASGTIGGTTYTWGYDSPAIPTASLSINKVSATDGSSLSGASFEIYRQGETDPIPDVSFTEDNGTYTLSSRLPKGIYTIVETGAPEHFTAGGPYTLDLTDMANPKLTSGNDTVEGLTASYTDGAITAIIPNNQVSFTYDITKTDESGNALAGAKFSLYNATVDEDGNYTKGTQVGQQLTSGSDGTLTFGTVGEGYYILEEDSAPSGYQTGGPWKLDFTNMSQPEVNGDNSTVSFANNTVSQTISNTLKDGSVKLTKTVLGGLGRVDDEFTFHVVIKNGETTISETDVKLTGNPVNGANTTTIQGKAGYTYTITETVPTGYTASINGTKTNTITGTFAADETTSVNVTNTAEGDVPTSLLVYNGPYIAMGVGVVVLGAMWFMLKRKKHSA